MTKIYELVKEEDDREPVSLGLFSTYAKASEELVILFYDKENVDSNFKRKWIDDESFVSSLGLSDCYYRIIERTVI